MSSARYHIVAVDVDEFAERVTLCDIPLDRLGNDMAFSADVVEEMDMEDAGFCSACVAAFNTSEQ